MNIAKLQTAVEDFLSAANNRQDGLNEIQRMLHSISEYSAQPVNLVLWVPIDLVEPNDYNPNSVARVEMQLLLRSINHDGYTQPVVTIYDPETGKYVIVDGFHRYFSMKSNAELLAACNGRLPIVVIQKDINDRMASTIRHNRARGKHSIKGMSTMVFNMLENGWEDHEICNELGMEPEELLRLKHVTGFSKLMADVEYSKAYKTKKQLEIEREYAKNGAVVSKRNE